MKFCQAGILLFSFVATAYANDHVRKLQATSEWEGPHELSLVGAGAANLPGGKVLLWAGQQVNKWGDAGSTETLIWDPSNNSMKHKTVNTGNFFCPGTTNMADGRLMLTGGKDKTKTTFYLPGNDAWMVGPDMNIGRGYQGQTMLENGDVFVIGGSWVGRSDRGDKHGELWSAATNSWKLLPGVLADPFLTNDSAGVYRSDNHAWLFLAPNNKIFHAGPSKQMHWITTSGNGSVKKSVTRGNKDAMNGNAVMYDVGKILALGGAENYDSGPGSNRAYIIDINGNEAKVTRTGNMRHPRTLGNSAVLPNGEVVTIGGASEAILFSDKGAVLTPEIWSPKSGSWTSLADMQVPRTYHSTVLLLKDGRVMAAGGGLCRCSADHQDVEVLTPPYLYAANGNLAKRPVIRSSPSITRAGQSFQVTMDTSGSHTFALVRLSSVTHSVNNDCRRIPLTAKRSGSVFTLSVPSNKRIALAGNYYLFAMNSNGVPSVGKDLQIALSGSFTPDPKAKYYIEFPIFGLRLAATGEAEQPYTVSDGTKGANVEWKFVAKGNGFWHLQRAAGGSKPRLRTLGDGRVDMQATRNSGVYTYFDFPLGYMADTVFFTLPDAPPESSRLQVDKKGTVKFVPSSYSLTWESVRVVKV